MTNILTINVPVPVPAIKTFSRWRMFFSLFNPHAHFTTCEALNYQIEREAEASYKVGLNASLNELRKSLKETKIATEAICKLADEDMPSFNPEHTLPESLNKSYFWVKQPCPWGRREVEITHKGKVDIMEVALLP